VGAIVRDLASIPLDSPIRYQDQEVFDVFGALIPLYQMYVAEGQDLGQPAWSEFWSKAQNIMLALCMKLYQGGYGFET
jgi:hypothetical protein